LGSTARNETSPFSDLDFCVFIEEDTPEARNYFTELLTEVEGLLQQMGDAGIKFCHGELTPPYYPTWVEPGREGIQRSERTAGSPQLLNTPEKMVEVSINAPEYDTGARKVSLEQSLTEVGFVHGNPNLVSLFRKGKMKELNTPLTPQEAKDNFSRFHRSGKLKRHLKALEKLRLMQKSFDSALTKLVESPEKPADIKKGALRQIQWLVTSLALYHGIDEPNTAKAIDLLIRDGHLNSQLGEEMKDCYSFFIGIRLKAQMHEAKETDIIGGPEIMGRYRLNEEETQQYHGKLRFLVSLSQMRHQFVTSEGSSKVFKTG
jgi:signal-transduction protein with cAMP-binding, CBS, and nucleotidyltransferase domain